MLARVASAGFLTSVAGIVRLNRNRNFASFGIAAIQLQMLGINAFAAEDLHGDLRIVFNANDFLPLLDC